jgi:hypothetical protein
MTAFGCGDGSDDSDDSAVFAAAPAGAQRLTLTLDEFELDPGDETYKCQNFANPLGRDVAILQSQSHMSSGSHHLAAFRFQQNVDGPLEDCSGLEFHATIHAAQTPRASTTYPPGVGAFLASAEGVRLNAHYFNLSKQRITAKVTVAIDYVEADQVTHKAAQIHLNDSTIHVPPGGGTAGGALTIPSEVGDIYIVSLQSHMHRRGASFAAHIGDGPVVYETTSWHEPPVQTYEPAIHVAAGTPISWHCDIRNDTAVPLTFGESADTNEMCVLTGYYYPAPEGRGLVGDVLLGRVGLIR